MFWSTKQFKQQKLSLKMLKHSAPVLNPMAQEQIKQRIVLSIQALPVPAVADWRLTPRPVHFGKLAVGSAFGLLAIFGTAYASTGANPGDILYPAKRVQETVRLTLATSEESRAQLQADFAHERIREIRNITKLKGSGIAKPIDTDSDQDRVAKNSAKNEIKNTLSNLQTTENHLKTQGKIEASLSIHEKIKSIKLEAKEQNLIEEPTEE